MNQKNFKFVFTVYFVLFGIVIALFGTGIGYKLQMIDIEKRINKNAEEIAFINKNNILAADIERVDTILKAVASNKTLLEYIKSPNEFNRATVENVFYALTLSDKYIMQTRFIDYDGKEKIRINRNNSLDLPFTTEKSKLQDKKDRDYFQIVSKNQPNTIWRSKIDLNIENGKIEVPYRPTIRLATPIYQENKFQGIVIVNILMDEILSKVSKSTVFDHYIVDKDGYFITHTDSKLSWSKYINLNVKLIDAFPLDASKILAGIPNGEEFYAYPLDDILQNDDDALLVLKPKKDYIDSLVQTNITTSIFVVILSILLSIPLAIYASLAPSRLQKSLFVSNSNLKRFADIIDKYVISVNTKTNSIITAVSSAFANTSGYSKEELVGQKMNIVRHPDTPHEVHKNLWETIEKGEEWKGELKNINKNEGEYWLEETIIPIKNQDNIVESYMSVGIDISAKKELEVLSTMDRLTGIFNRRKLDELLDHHVQTAKRYERPISLLMVDIDYFKNINDSYGHQVGDDALVRVATILKENIRLSDVVGRFGGEEFIIIAPECEQNSALELAEKLRNAIEQYPFETFLHATISIGVAQMEASDTVFQWVNKADKALYNAKETGRNKVVCSL